MEFFMTAVLATATVFGIITSVVLLMTGQWHVASVMGAVAVVALKVALDRARYAASSKAEVEEMLRLAAEREEKLARSDIVSKPGLAPTSRPGETTK